MKRKSLVLMVVCMAVLASTQIYAGVLYGWFYTFQGVLSEYTGTVTDMNAGETAGKGTISYDAPLEKIKTDYYLNEVAYTGTKLYLDGNIYGVENSSYLVDLTCDSLYYHDSEKYTGKKYYNASEIKYYGNDGTEKSLTIDGEHNLKYYYTVGGSKIVWNGTVYTNAAGDVAGYNGGSESAVNNASTAFVYTDGGNSYIYDSELIRTDASGNKYGCINGTVVDITSSGEGTYKKVSDNSVYTGPVFQKNGQYYGCYNKDAELKKTTLYYDNYNNMIVPNQIADVSEFNGEITVTTIYGEKKIANGRTVYLYMTDPDNVWNQCQRDVYVETVNGVEHYYCSWSDGFELTYTPSAEGAKYNDDGVEKPYTGTIYSTSAGSKGYIGGSEVLLTSQQDVKYIEVAGKKEVFTGYVSASNKRNEDGTLVPLSPCAGTVYYYTENDKTYIYDGHIYEDNTGFVGGTEFLLDVTYKYKVGDTEYTGPVTVDGSKGVSDLSLAQELEVKYTYRYKHPVTGNTEYEVSTDGSLSKKTLDIVVDVAKRVKGVEDDDPDGLRIVIGDYVSTLPVMYDKFAEPTVLVKDANENVSNQYAITYSFAVDDPSEIEEYADANGVMMVRHKATGTTISKNRGNVETSGSGDVNVLITATPLVGSGTFTNMYPLYIQADEANVIFAPAFLENGEGKYINLPVAKMYAGDAYYMDGTYPMYIFNKSVSVLPKYFVKTVSASGVETEITDRFDVSVSFTPGSVSYTSDPVVTFADNKLTYAGDGDQYNYQNRPASVMDAKLAQLEAYKGTLTYTFTPKAEYAGIYDEFTQDVTVGFKNQEGKKGQLVLSLPRELILEDNVTGSEYDPEHPDESGYTIHVYKYGSSMSANKYQYPTPIPGLMTTAGTEVPVFQDTKMWGDFKLTYKVVGDSTYYDDCGWDKFAKTGTIQKAGESTGFTYGDYFQVSKPGLIKIAVYATLPKDDPTYGADLRYAFDKPQEDGHDIVITDAWGADQIVYSEPVYFYVDVMKRVPKLVFDPDPNTILFVQGDKVNIPTRFTVHGEIDDASNGEEGYLIWGTESDASTVDGKVVDAFVYDFFISDRLDQKIRVNDWPKSADWDEKGGDDHSFIDWVEVSKNTNDPIRVGDSILVDGVYVGITEANISLYSGRTLLKGDKERGTTYHSMKGWNNESWTLEFLEDGKYTIPYVICPWNHVRWDKGAMSSIEYDIDHSRLYDTQIELSYTFQTASTSDGSKFLEPTAKVVAPQLGNYDVTDLYDLTYFFGVNTLTGDTITTDDATGTKVDRTTGQITIGTTEGDVQVYVHAKRKELAQSALEAYKNPADVFYTIRINDGGKLATWEVISSCKHEACVLHATTCRFDDINDANGRFHFLTQGDIYGGTTVYSVPGISFTVGTAASSAAAVEWRTAVTTAPSAQFCCQHETESSCVFVEGLKEISFDAEGVPTAGSFFKFAPIVNGYLTVDANFKEGHRIILLSKNSKTGDIISEVFNAPAGGIIGDHTFDKALIAGETYYLYDATEGGVLRMHGFAYQPAFVVDRNTEKTASEAGLTGVTFLNGLSTGLPTLSNSSNLSVSYDVEDDDHVGVNPADYVTVNSNGALAPKKMTIGNDNKIFTLHVTAEVKSSDETLGDCVTKRTFYDLKIIDIPTYTIATNKKDVLPNTTVTTTNIKTDITMTFGGWKDDDGKYDGSRTDGNWDYKNTVAADRIGSELENDSPVYNKTIDGFEHFVAANQNPVDESNYSPLKFYKTYKFGSGVEAEGSDLNLNTTYRVPCRGNFIKFEPRESGDLLVYMVQNGSVDYHYGITKMDKQYQVKWRPLFITDETGRPVEMINEFGDMSASLLPTGTDHQNPGAFTLGLSRCGKNEAIIKNTWTYDEDKAHGTSFDWSEFLGTEEDRTKLINAWPERGERESMIRLENGGFVLPHKAYVRYAFKVKAGKTYFVFQPGSKFEFGGFSFVPAGFPDHSKYNIAGELNAENQEKDFAGNQFAGEGQDLTFTWNDVDNFNTSKENICVTINDRRASELTSASDKTVLKPRSFTAGNWEGICLPFSVSSSEAEQVFGKGYQVVTCTGVSKNNDQVLQFVRHANTYIEAGRPYLVKPAKSGTFSFKNVTIEGDIEVATSSSDTKAKLVNPERFDVDVRGEYTFKGIYKRETMPALSYFVQGDGLHRYANDTKIGGYRAYFAVNNSSVAPTSLAYSIKDLVDGSMEDEDVETGILYIDSEGTVEVLPENSAVYGVDGKKIGEGADALNSAAGGVYIVGGKKIVK